MQTYNQTLGNLVQLKALTATDLQTNAYKNNFIAINTVEPSLGLPTGISNTNPNNKYFFPVLGTETSYLSSRRITGLDTVYIQGSSLKVAGNLSAAAIYSSNFYQTETSADIYGVDTPSGPDLGGFNFFGNTSQTNEILSGNRLASLIYDNNIKGASLNLYGLSGTYIDFSHPFGVDYNMRLGSFQGGSTSNFPTAEYGGFISVPVSASFAIFNNFYQTRPNNGYDFNNGTNNTISYFYMASTGKIGMGRLDSTDIRYGTDFIQPTNTVTIIGGPLTLSPTNSAGASTFALSINNAPGQVNDLVLGSDLTGSYIQTYNLKNLYLNPLGNGVSIGSPGRNLTGNPLQLTVYGNISSTNNIYASAATFGANVSGQSIFSPPAINNYGRLVQSFPRMTLSADPLGYFWFKTTNNNEGNGNVGAGGVDVWDCGSAYGIQTQSPVSIFPTTHFWYTSGIGRMTLDVNGNVYIGNGGYRTPFNTTPLTVVGSISSTNNIYASAINVSNSISVGYPLSSYPGLPSLFPYSSLDVNGAAVFRGATVPNIAPPVVSPFYGGVDAAQLTGVYIVLPGVNNSQAAVNAGTDSGGSDWAFLRQIGGHDYYTLALDLFDNGDSLTAGQAFTIRNVNSGITPNVISTRFMVDGLGNVGIGTALPNQNLTVVGNISSTNNIYATNIISSSTVSTTTISANNTFGSGNQYVVSDGAGNNNIGNGANTISLNALSGTYIGSNLTVKGNLSATGKIYSTNTVNKAVTSIGNNVDKAFNFVHNLGSQDVITQVYSNTNNIVVTPTIANISTTTVSLSFSTPPALTAYRVVVIG
jgi:hypothetical protein